MLCTRRQHLYRLRSRANRAEALPQPGDRPRKLYRIAWSVGGVRSIGWWQ